MSNCDGLTIKITNNTTDVQGNPMPIKIMGVNPDGQTTVDGFSVDQTIESGATATGYGYSGSGSNGSVYGNIEIHVLYGYYDASDPSGSSGSSSISS